MIYKNISQLILKPRPTPSVSGKIGVQDVDHGGHMLNLGAWLEKLDILCARILQDPVSGLYKMDLAAALSHGKYYLVVPTGKGSAVDHLVEDLVEAGDKVRRQIWDAGFTLGSQYLKTVRRMIAALRGKISELTAEISRSDQLLSSPAAVALTTNASNAVSA